MSGENVCPLHGTHELKITHAEDEMVEIKKDHDEVFKQMRALDSGKLNFKTFVLFLTAFGVIFGSIVGYQNMKQSALQTDIKATQEKVMDKLNGIDRNVTVMRSDVNHLRADFENYQRRNETEHNMFKNYFVPRAWGSDDARTGD